MKKAQLLTWLAASAFALGQEKPDLKVDPIPQSDYYKMAMTANVVDENDKPIEGAEVNLGFPHGMSGDKVNNYIGKSDGNGSYHAESLTCSSFIEIIAEKEGYYKSRLTYEYFSVNTGTPEELKKTGRFEPWNPTVKMMLKKIGKPIPMLVRLNDSITVPT